MNIQEGAIKSSHANTQENAIRSNPANTQEVRIRISLVNTQSTESKERDSLQNAVVIVITQKDAAIHPEETTDLKLTPQNGKRLKAIQIL